MSAQDFLDSAGDIAQGKDSGALSSATRDQSHQLDLAAMRLPINYGGQLGVKKLLTTVRVGRPAKGTFFRTHPDLSRNYSGLLIERGQDRETYLLHPTVADAVPRDFKAVQLFQCIDRHGTVFLMPVTISLEGDRQNPWHISLAAAVDRARAHWVRVDANMAAGAYDVLEATARLPDPEWPSESFEDVLKAAFRNRFITSVDHPIIEQLLGKA